MTRSELLDAYLAEPQMVEKRLSGLPPEVLHFKPTPESWSVHEIIVHLADSEASGYIRCFKIIAEPGSDVTAYDQDKWTDILKGRERSTQNALGLLKALRVSAHEVLSGVSGEAWDQQVNHPEHESYTLSDWLGSYIDHIKGHLSQIDRNLADWEKAGKPATV